MSDLNILKKRRDSILSTQKITNAVNNISSVRFIKLRNAIYVAKHNKDIYDDISISFDFNKDEQILFVFGTDKGLCGNFNMIVFRKFLNFYKSNTFSNVKIYVFGKKLQTIFSSHSNIKVEFCSYESQINLSIDKIISLITNRQQVFIIYEKFINVITHTPEVYTVQSIKNNKDEVLAEVDIDEFLTTYFMAIFYYVLISSQASEESARMRLMDSATKNIKELSQNLLMKMNRIRQSAITNQLIEIISGIESLKEKSI